MNETHPVTPLAAVPDDVVEAYVEELVQEDPGQFASCCSGTHVDWVEYGSTTVPMPAAICECVFEGAQARVEEDITSGELVLTTAGRLVPNTTDVPLKDIVTSADTQSGGMNV